jgi:hypothetical protein
LTPFKKSEPIPEVNNEPVKVVVADNIHDVVFKSGKNGMHPDYSVLLHQITKLFMACKISTELRLTM